MRDAISKRWREFAAILFLVIAAAGVGGYILANQRFTLPGWVPFVGQNSFTLKGEFSTAQAVTPGQGQTVDIAGVKVGQITGVTLHEGRALVTMSVQPKYAAIYHDATMLLRPKTGLKDMIVELTPGDPTTGKLRSGDTIPIQNTLPDVNLDEILAALDGDSRRYLQLLLNAGATALRGDGGTALGAVIRRFDPTTVDLGKINHMLARRRTNLEHVIHNFASLSRSLGARDQQLAGLVDSSNAVFARFAHQDAALRDALGLLPGALDQTRTTLAKVNTLAPALGSSLGRLRPAARALGPALHDAQPFLRHTTPIIANQLRPFARAALPTARALRPATRELAKLTPGATTSLKVVNELLNELAFNPGPNQPGYLFYLAWANHDANSVFAGQDAHGPIRRGLLVLSCSSLDLLTNVSQVNTSVRLLLGLLNAPICPNQAGPRP